MSYPHLEQLKKKAPQIVETNLQKHKPRKKVKPTVSEKVLDRLLLSFFQ